MEINIKDLAEELGMTRQALNYNIKKGRAGEVEKAIDTQTGTYLITPENVLTLITWLKDKGRCNMLKVMQAEKKYKQLIENE